MSISKRNKLYPSSSYKHGKRFRMQTASPPQHPQYALRQPTELTSPTFDTPIVN